MKWGIIGAMPSEVALLREEMQERNEVQVGRFTFWEGVLYGQEVALSQCGVGKVNAAIVTQLLLDRFGAEQVVNTGVAGAMHEQLKVLDVVVSRELVYHDYEMRFLRDYMPFLEKIEASPALVEQAVEAFEAIDHGSSCCFAGRIATGDQFVESRQVKESIVERFHPMCVEMEGAAIGHVCAAAQVPFVVIRTMSDSADDSAGMSFDEFKEIASQRSADIVCQMLRTAR